MFSDYRVLAETVLYKPAKPIVMKKTQHNITRFGIILALVFWVVDSFIDAQLSSEGTTFLESLLEPGAAEIWMRSFVVLLFLVFSAYTQRLLRIINSMTDELKMKSTKSNSPLKSSRNLQKQIHSLHWLTGASFSNYWNTRLKEVSATSPACLSSCATSTTLNK